MYGQEHPFPARSPSGDRLGTAGDERGGRMMYTGDDLKLMEIIAAHIAPVLNARPARRSC